MGKEISASAETTIAFRQAVGASKVSGHTEREVECFGYPPQVRGWASIEGQDELLAHPLANEFRVALDSASFLKGDSLTVFRGQSIEERASPPSISRMGPPPFASPTGGRYHRIGEIALYLSNSEDGARREMAFWNKAGKTPWVIRSVIPIGTLRIADFTDLPIDSLATAVFEQAETCNVLGRGSGSYSFSQMVAEIVGERFDGMMIPGTRGETGSHYKNIVLFRCFEDWPKWEHGIPYILKSN
jgi:RES domain